MPSSITINGITGTSPYNITLCDTDPVSPTCVWIAQITDLDLPYTFTPPISLQYTTSFLVKIVDAGFPCTIITPPILRTLNPCYPVYVDAANNEVYSFDPSSYGTSSYFDPGVQIDAMTRSDDKLWIFDSSQGWIYEYDTTGYTTPTIIRQIDTTYNSIDIYGMCVYSSTELLALSSTGDVNIINISTNTASVTGLPLYNIGGTPQNDCNLLRDDNIGITYMKTSLTGLKAFYDDGTQYSTATWPSGNQKGFFRDSSTAEIYGVNNTGGVYKIPQPPGSVTPSSVTTISPDNLVSGGLGQSNSCIPPVSSFKMFFTNLTGVTIGFSSTSFSWIDWGDGNTISGQTGLGTKSHTYSSPYTGFITMYNYNDFQDFTSLGQSYSLNSSVTSGTSIELPSQYFLLSEMKKIKGLKSIFINAYGGFPPSGSTSDLPSGLTTCNFIQNPGYVSGFTSTFPTGLVTCIMNGDFYGDVAGLPRPLDYLALRNSHFTGHIYDFPSGLTTLSLYGTDTFSGDSSEWSKNLNSLSLFNQSVTYGNVSNLPSGLTYLYLSDYNVLSGNTSDLPSGLTTNYIYGFNTISGDTSGLPRSGNTIIEGFNTISGNISDLPYSATLIAIKGNNTISGDTSGLPGNITYFKISQQSGIVNTGNTISGNISGFTGSLLTSVYITGSNTISGDTTDIPTTSSFSSLSLFGFNTLSGNIKNIPPNIDEFVVYGNNQLSGNISGLSTSTLTQFQVGGNNTISGGFSGFPTSPGIKYFTLSGGSIDYTPGSASGMGLPNGLTQFIYTPSGAVGSALSSADVDSIIFAATGITWAGTSRALTIKGGNSSPTVASFPARQQLSGGSFNVTVLTN
jgi:hypothetical protein